MPSAHSPSRSRSDRKGAWPTAGTHLFTGADLDEAVAAAIDELGAAVEVRAARSVKQGLRGKTHVEVLVALVDDHAGAAHTRPPLPPSEQSDQGARRPAHAARKHGPDSDPVESTLASLLASADAEEDAFQRAAIAERAGTIVPFEPPQLTGNPTFAAEFAAAFPAALAAAKAGEDAERDPEPPVRNGQSSDDFTKRVREALRRVPTDDADDASAPLRTHADDDTDELVIVRPASAASAHLSRSSAVPPDTFSTAHPSIAPVGQSEHPALDMIDDLSRQPAAPPAANPVPPMPVKPHQTHVVTEGGRRKLSFPGPLAMVGRPASLRRPAGSGWSMERLRDLGVPEGVLRALPIEEPTDDLRWLVALTDAITAVVPTPVEEGLAEVSASGTGLRGALALLRLGVDGVPPHMLTVDGRALPATATELALAIRAGILR